MRHLMIIESLLANETHRGVSIVCYALSDLCGWELIKVDAAE